MSSRRRLAFHSKGVTKEGSCQITADEARLLDTLDPTGTYRQRTGTPSERALDHFVASAWVRPGDLVLSAAAGGGWYAAAALYTLGEIPGEVAL